MTQIHVNITLPRTPLFQGQASAVVLDEMTTGMRESLTLVDGELVKRTPVGVSGRMRSGYQPRINIVSTQPVRLHGEVVNVTPYALYVDQGSAPHWPPWGPGSDLARWVQRKLGADVSAFLIARKISRVGTKAQNIVNRTLQVVRGPITSHFQTTVLNRIVRRLGGS